MEAVKQVRTASVYKGDRLAATLARTDAGVRFSYVEAYLDDLGPAVAFTLPLSEQPVVTTAGAVPAFFAGLLPEGRRLSSLRRAVKTSADDELSLLLAVGGDPVGDVRVLPEAAKEVSVEPLVQVRKSFSEVAFSDVFGEAGIVDRVAIAGVQDKASARMLSLPIVQSGRRYILKVDPPEYPHLVENEAYFIGLAVRSRFPVVSASLVHDVTGRPGLLVERFDRVSTPAGGTLSRAVEDAAQALGVYPADKYNLTSEQVITRLAGLCPARPVAVRDLYRQFCFAWLTGNGDLHAKNVSVLNVDGEWRVAPAYDVPSTLPYNDRTMALGIGGKTSGLSRRLLVEFGARVGLNHGAATRVLDQTLAATETLEQEWSAGSSPFGPAVVRDVLRVLRFRRRAVSAVL